MKLINMYFRHKTHCCLLHLSTVESISPLNGSWAILTKDHQPKAPKCETSVLFSTSSLHFGLPATNGVSVFPHPCRHLFYLLWFFFFFIIAILRQLSIISYSDFPSLNLLSWKLSSSLIFVLWWPTKMHVKKRSDVQLKIRVEGEIRARGKIKLEVLLPCRGDLGLSSWLSSNHLKEENIICSISKSQPNPKQSDRCGLEIRNPGNCIYLNFPYEIKPEQLLRRWSFIKLIGRNCVVWGINPLSNPFMVRAIKTDIWRHE